VSSGMIAGFGFSTIQKRDLSDLDDILSRIEDLGASHAELSLGGADLVCGGRILTHRVDRLERICARHRLRYTAHGPLAANFMDPVHLDAYRTAVGALIEVCGAVGATVLVQHSGRARAAPRAEIERLHRVERDALRALADIGARRGVKLAVETLWVFDRAQYTATAARLADEIRAIDHPFVCGTLDFSHVYLYSTFLGLDFRAQVEAFAPVAGHLHVHDSFGRPKLTPMYAPSEELAFGLGDLHLPLGWGDIPWDDMLPTLTFRDDTAFIVELPPQFAAEAPAVAAEARRLIGLAGGAR
jgi:sugar phosphate isomerase/epimerase